MKFLIAEMIFLHVQLLYDDPKFGSIEEKSNASLVYEKMMQDIWKNMKKDTEWFYIDR